MIGSFRELVKISFSTVLQFGGWARTVACFECNDARDKIYGLLDIVTWPAGVVAIEPDYTKSAVQLAGTLVRFMQDAMQFEDLTAIARGLGITAYDNELSKIVARRRQTVEPPAGYAERPSLEVGMICAAVRADYNGILRCSVYRLVDGFPDRLELHAKFVHKLENSRSTTLGAWQGVWFENEIAAIVCDDVQEGDLIAEMDGWGSPTLILRHVRDVHFTVIGQGFLLPAFSMCFNGRCVCPRGVKHDSQRLYLEVEMSFEDMVLFVGQDITPSSSQCDVLGDLGYDVDARCARPRTRVSEFLTTSARVVPDSMFKYQPTPEIVAAMREDR
ncbi:hypothetical protein Slin14017_G019690 [Septoria linicola]|nr:hypothetical protein Slin14017_G019690 [Septoria linicola]